MLVRKLSICVVFTGVMLVGFWCAQRTARAEKMFAPPSQVEIGSFQVMQGVQVDESQPSLIGDFYGRYKPIVVRVAAHTTAATPLTVTIQATLAFTLPSTLTPRHEIKSQPARVVLSNQMPQLTDEEGLTLDIVINDQFAKDADTFTVQVEISSTTSPPQLLARSAEITYPISRTQTPQIFFYPVKFPNETRPATDTISSTVAAGFVKGIFPATDSEDFYRQTPYPTFTCPVIDIGSNEKIGTDHVYSGLGSTQIKTPSEACMIFHHLTALRNGLATCDYGPDPYTFVYGWVKDNPITANGYGIENGWVAFGNTEASRGQRTFAHELTHNLGLIHAEEKQIGRAGWDVGGRLFTPDNFWTTNITTSLKFPWLFDITAPGKETHQAWVAADTYSTLQQKLIVNGQLTSTPHPACLLQQLQSDFEPAMFTTYTKDFCIVPQEDGSYLAYPFPLTQWGWALQPTPKRTTDMFTLQYETESGQTLSSWHDARIGADPQDPALDLSYGFLAATIPYPPDAGAITAIRIFDRNGNLVPIYDPVISAYTPSLRNRKLDTPFTLTITTPVPIGIEAPVARAITETAFTVAWTLDPPQPPNLQQFEYQVLYSHNGGRVWTPLAVNLPGNVQTVTINRELLCTTTDVIANSDTGILRVVGSDGFNSAQDEIRVSLTGAAQVYCERGTIREDDFQQYLIGLAAQ